MAIQDFYDFTLKLMDKFRPGLRPWIVRTFILAGIGTLVVPFWFPWTDAMLIINLLLALFGFIGSLAAFGGETWVEGNTPILKKITKRGWVALLCLLVAFVLGGVKEIALSRASKVEAAEKKRLRAENIQQAAKIKNQLKQIDGLQDRLEASTQKLTTTTVQIGEQQLASIEAAFELAIKRPRETDNAFIEIRGQPIIHIPSRRHREMQLYWGDQFHFVLLSDSDISARELSSLKLEVGGRIYPLHDGIGIGSFEETLRIYGDSPRPMLARILNPMRLTDVEMKIFVKTTDSSQGQEEFRRIILTSPFREFAQMVYKSTKANVLNVRTNPEITAPIRSRLARGSFIRVLQTQDNWTEILTPEGRQGWVTSQYLGEIE